MLNWLSGNACMGEARFSDPAVPDMATLFICRASVLRSPLALTGCRDVQLGKGANNLSFLPGRLKA